ncbi:MAG: hypothetical protein KDA21_07755, partial [Phycisphaerales bacterium]|nr:hypothetical protein [Phycisphaerales bacterium]
AVRDDGAAVWEAARNARITATTVKPPIEDFLPLTPRMTVELELAGRMQPLAGDTFESAAAGITPGSAGLAARSGERLRVLFPGVMLATSTSPEEGLRSVVAGLDILVGAEAISRGKLELAGIRQKHDLSVYRFQTTHLAQHAPRLGPVFLRRGGRVVTERIRSDLLRSTADGIAAHLLTHDWPATEEPRGMTGPYLPWLDEYRPFEATPFQQALTSWALQRYASTPGVDPQTAAAAKRFAASLLAELLIPLADEPDPLASPVDAAMLLVAASATDEPVLGRTVRMDAIASLRACAEDDGAFGKLRPVERSIVALALARCAEASDDGLRDLAARRVSELFLRTERGELVSLMPWLGWAQMELVGADDPIPAAIALRDMRETTWQFQLTAEDAGLEDADLAGGVVFTRGRTPLPTWNTLRPVAFIATMLGDERLTSVDERADELLRLLSSLRFLVQLTIRESETWFCVEGDLAVGGVRAAPWDATLPLEANCLGLLTLCETLESARRLR